MLLSDRDLRAEIAAGRLGIDPFDDALVQPSSVDVRLDTLFRVFNNTRYTHIDPAQQQDELTSLVEPDEGEPFVLHPGEFVLGSTLETCTLPEDLAGRLDQGVVERINAQPAGGDFGSEVAIGEQHATSVAAPLPLTILMNDAIPDASLLQASLPM